MKVFSQIYFKRSNFSILKEDIGRRKKYQTTLVNELKKEKMLLQLRRRKVCM